MTTLKEHLRKLGSKGGRAQKKKVTPAQLRQWGLKGARKTNKLIAARKAAVEGGTV